MRSGATAGATHWRLSVLVFSGASIAGLVIGAERACSGKRGGVMNSVTWVKHLISGLARRTRIVAAVGIAVSALGAGACSQATSPEVVSSGAAPAAPAVGAAPEAGQILTATIPASAGPRRVVAVSKFTTIGSFTANYGDWDIGGGLAAMLVSALKESGSFIVVERAKSACRCRYHRVSDRASPSVTRPASPRSPGATRTPGETKAM
jgi:hypothetical protein